MSKDKFSEFLQDPNRRRLFEQESLAFEATEMICDLMERERVTKADLAKKIGRSRAYVTQVLSGTRNMTLHTFADLAFALGYTVKVKPSPVDNPGGVHRWASSSFRVVYRNRADWNKSNQIATRLPLFSVEETPETAHAA